jgi:hypothetical protein
MKGNRSRADHLGACDFRTAETSTGADLDSVRPHVHGDLHRLLHGAAKPDAALQLACNALGNQCCVKFRLLDLDDVDLGLLAPGESGDLAGHGLDLTALSSDDDTRAGCENGDADAVPGTLNDDSGNCGRLELLLQPATDLLVSVEEVRKFLLAGIPA